MTETKTDILKGIYQIWYDDQTQKMCSDYFTPFHNPELTPFFENEVIYNLCLQGQHLESEWFGVLSPKFFNKLPRIGRYTPGLIRDKLTDNIDLLSMTNLQNRNIILQGNHAHTRKTGNFSAIVQGILRESGIDWNVRNPLRFPVLMNYVLARGWVWDRYFREMLKPCMDTMKNATGELHGLLWQDAEYKVGPPNERRKILARMKESFGVDYYPMHTFILERLWSVWLEMNWDDVRKKKYLDR